MPRNAPLFLLLGLLASALSTSLRADDPLLESLAPAASQSGERQVRGVLRARNQAVLSSELPGRCLLYTSRCV